MVMIMMVGKQRGWIVPWAVWMLWLLVRPGCLWGRVMGLDIRYDRIHFLMYLFLIGYMFIY